MDPKLSKSIFIDSHCHLPLLREPVEIVLEKCREKSVLEILNVGFDRKSSEDSLALTKFDFIKASAGIHPHYVGGDLQADMEWLSQIITKKGMVAIGEIGLDTIRSSTPRDVQIKWFEAQLDIAKANNMPVIIHNRSADTDIEEILLKHPTLKGVLHCYSSGFKFGKIMFNKGWFVSFSGNITYQNSEEIKQVLVHVPAKQLLLETDAPYLTPVPFRGKRENSPDLIPAIYEFTANLRNISIEELSLQVRKNYQTLFTGEKE